MSTALHDELPTNEDEIDAEPAMLAAVQLVERAAELFEGESISSLACLTQARFVQIGNAQHLHLDLQNWSLQMIFSCLSLQILPS